jgi:O-methyltransferase involved in polyketide biosynthesis
MTGEIEHVTDTAFWVASYRALESERPDALFRDPLAGLLSGEKGKQIARSALLLWPLGPEWQKRADQILGYTLLERQGP